MQSPHVVLVSLPHGFLREMPLPFPVSFPPSLHVVICPTRISFVFRSHMVPTQTPFYACFCLILHLTFHLCPSRRSVTFFLWPSQPGLWAPGRVSRVDAFFSTNLRSVPPPPPEFPYIVSLTLVFWAYRSADFPPTIFDSISIPPSHTPPLF